MHSPPDDPPVRDVEGDLRSRAIREKYEERLMGMTERLRIMVDDLKQDEVIATMKEDPASAPFVKARMRELVEGHFSNEREETIEKLMRELANIQAENQRLGRENAQLRTSTRSLEDQIRTERSKVETTERDNRDLRSKTAVTSRQYEDSLRQLEEDSATKLQLALGEAEKLREMVEKSNRDLWVKSSETDLLRQDLDTEKGRTTKALTQVEAMQRAYAELEQDYEKLQATLQSSSGSSADLVQRLNRAMGEIAVLERTGKTYEKEKEELREKYLAYSKEIREALETEQKSTAEAIDGLRQAHKAKCSLFKKKILDQKAKLRAFDSENNELRSELEAVRAACEHSIELVQEDMRQIRDEWEAKCKSVEMAANARYAELQGKQQAMIAQIKSQCQTLVDEKVSEMQEDYSHQLAQHHQTEADLRRQLAEHTQTLDKDYILTQQHDKLLNDELARLKAQVSMERKAVEEDIAAEYGKKIAILTAEHEEEMQKISIKLKQCEEKEEIAEAGKRKMERELDYSNERIEQLTNKISGLTTELTELEGNKRTMMRYVDEAGVNLAKLKAMYEDEAARRKAGDETITSLRDKVRALEAVAAKLEAEHREELHTIKLKTLEDTTKLQEALEKQQNVVRKQASELQKLHELQEKLHNEKKELHENHRKTAEELKQHSMRLKQEGVSLYEAEVAAHRETMAALEGREQDLKEMGERVERLERELEQERGKVQELTESEENMAGLLKTLRRETDSASSEKAILFAKISDLRSKFEYYKDHVSTSIKSLCQQSQDEVSSIRKSVLSDLMEYQKLLSKQGTDMLTGLEDREMKTRRSFSLAVMARNDQVKALEKEKAKLEKCLSDDFNSKSAQYEAKIADFELSVAHLNSEITSQKAESEALIEKITDLQLQESRLREENDSLQGELTTAMQDLNYSRMDKEQSEVQMKTNFQEAISEREGEIEEKYRRQLEQLEEMVEELRKSNEEMMGRFAAEVQSLQGKHREEMMEKERKYGEIIAETQKELDIAQRQRYEMEEVIEETMVEVTDLRAEALRSTEAMEDELSELLATLHTEQEKIAQYRQDKTAEIEEFARKLKLITRELQEKDENLEKTNHDKEMLRSQLKEIRDSQVKRELADLRGSVERSLSATAKDLRPQKKPEEEEIRPEKRKIPLSLSQLKASLERFS